MIFEMSKEILFQEILNSRWWRIAKSFRGTVPCRFSQWTRLCWLWRGTHRRIADM